MNVKILMLGDLVGAPGRAVFQKHIEAIRAKHGIDAVIVNGENSASDGRGITTKIMKFFKHHKVDVVTTGNHIWAKKDIYGYFAENKDLIRPANFPSGCPGSGIATFTCKGVTVGVLNLQGRVFMRELLACPFRAADSALTFLKSKTNVILVDFHAETSSEKMGLAYYLDGKISGFVGTHTHVPTADARILPGGTAYITDLGMGGALNSMIGMKKDSIIQNMITQMPVKFEVDTDGPMRLCGVIITIDASTGKAEKIEQLIIVDTELRVSADQE